MRLRNIPRAESVIEAHPVAIKDEISRKGKWGEEFGNERPIHIEIGMGKGRFLLNMAKLHPQVNYIGIERYSSVLLRALELYDTEEFCDLKNVRMICMDAVQIDDVFDKNEVSRIYLNFSDPWPKAKHARRRLTSREFLARYEQIIPKGGQLEFKTDNTELFNFSLEEVRESSWELSAYTYNLHNHEKMNEGNVMTEYEEKFSKQGNQINKMIAVRK
ncbi:tRNA (guanosine(46)-N7)-methyltransferase TrmB [Hespellia stercorisuis]|uniref:tRNA (guanine-N(7)-)-methyltransferase n=1 Tax=Hespellia stercorisuis DSM 15480 TaxID=1121950 RepID=A0A1M6K6I5_9FIRM|nr:tRNA (guanosine(46)-N7)-methyltransferase TrmB [Hespellia stercorisuis]SHJ54569.1 tRNA (guanine-N(7)-)-methyltransferase [Hespellia stercorisuis DSM 15480]